MILGIGAAMLIGPLALGAVAKATDGEDVKDFASRGLTEEAATAAQKASGALDAVQVETGKETIPYLARTRGVPTAELDRELRHDYPAAGEFLAQWDVIGPRLSRLADAVSASVEEFRSVKVMPIAAAVWLLLAAGAAITAVAAVALWRDRDRAAANETRSASTGSRIFSPKMTQTSADNPALPPALRALIVVEAGVLAVAGIVPFFFPETGLRELPWESGPFNIRFIGAVYLASLAAVLFWQTSFRWAPGRVALLMVSVFTSLVLVVTLFYADRFDSTNPGTWIWFVLYVAIPVATGYVYLRLRNMPPAGARPTPPGMARLPAGHRDGARRLRRGSPHRPGERHRLLAVGGGRLPRAPLQRDHHHPGGGRAGDLPRGRPHRVAVRRRRPGGRRRLCDPRPGAGGSLRGHR